MRTFKTTLLVCACVLLAGAGAWAQVPPTAEFTEAAQAYDAGRFAEARALYEAIAGRGNYSANLFYDLGNVSFRMGEPGRAILNYERALALEPSHPEARANLDFVRTQAGARAEAKTWLDYLAAPFGINTLAIAGAVAVWVLLLAFFCLRTARRMRPLLWMAALLALAALVASGIGVALFQRDRSLAVVTDKQVEARLEPLDNSTLSETLAAGSEVRVLSDRGSWLYCSLPDSSRAWLPSKSVGMVRLPDS